MSLISSFQARVLAGLALLAIASRRWRRIGSRNLAAQGQQSTAQIVCIKSGATVQQTARGE